MANVQYIHTFLFLALFACVEIQISEGRQLKAINDHEFRKAMKGEQSPSIHKDDLQVTGKKDVNPPTMPTQSHELSSSEVSHSTDFRPTTPGNSPGVGHSFAGQKEKSQPKVHDFTSSAANTDDFRPTVPGHSPGIGHFFRTANAGPNA